MEGNRYTTIPDLGVTHIYDTFACGKQTQPFELFVLTAMETLETKTQQKLVPSTEKGLCIKKL